MLQGTNCDAKAHSTLTTPTKNIDAAANTLSLQTNTKAVKRDVQHRVEFNKNNKTW